MQHASLQEINLTTRISLHLLPGIAVIFLSIYGKIVCPFIDTLSFGQIFLGLGGIFICQVMLRELFYYQFPISRWPITAARHGFHLSVASWLIAGLAALVLHGYLYPNFHWGSHIKLLSGYWGLGAGILSQLEQVILEKYFREIQATDQAQLLEQFTARLMEKFIVFTLVPVMMMTLMSFRFVYEGYSDRGAAMEVLFLGFCFVLTALFVAWRFGQVLKNDCDHLLDGVKEITNGRFHIHVDNSRADELGQVATGFNEMARGLVLRERIREAFGRFVNPEVASSFIEQYAGNNREVVMGGQQREVAILMADIRGFTPLSQGMHPTDLTELLNAYFSEMVTAISNHGGMVDKFIGDAIMAVFGLPEQRTEFALDAVKAALEMRTRLAQFNETRRILGAAPINNGIGIHIGEVIAGYIGSADRLEFTVIGHPVNLAARIEGESKPPNPPILFTEIVAKRIAKEIPSHQVTSTELKGISGKTTLYTTAIKID